MIDSHSHLDRLECDTDEALVRARDAGVRGVLCPGVERESYEAVRLIAARHADVWHAAGIHPDAVAEDETASLDAWLGARISEGIVALGETGLDWFRDAADDTGLQQRQIDSFAIHLKLGVQHDLPIIVHTRSAGQKTLDVIEESGRGSRGVIHCFTEDRAFAERAVDLGYMISFSGIVTFKSAQSLREVAATVPQDKLLVETDAPWLAPVPRRGKANEPAYVAHTLNCVAECRDMEPQELADLSTANFFSLFPRAGQISHS